MRVLYVEDLRSDADLTVRALHDAGPGIQVEIAASLTEARARLAEFEGGIARGEVPLFDLLLLDVNLPDGNGLNLLAEVRQHALPLAVVVLTSSGDDESVFSALRAGADDYLPKRHEYWLRLPATLRSALASFRSQASRRARPLNLLYAEPNEHDVTLTRIHLASHAPFLRLEVVPTAAEVLSRLPPSGDVVDVDVVLLDYRLPGMNAIEALKEIKSVRNLQVPVIITTGHGTEEVALQALKLGAADYIVKSEGYLSRLPAAVEAAFHRAQAVRENAALARREQELRESEEKLRLFVEHAPSAIAMFDRDMRYLAYSHRWLADYGLGEQDLTGRCHYDVFPELPDRWKEVYRRCLNGATEKREEDPFPRPDGSVDWVRWEVHPWRTSAGDIGGIIIFSEVITDRKLAEESLRERVRLAALGADVGVALTLGETLQRMLQLCCEAVVRHLHAAFARIWTLNERDSMLELQASAGMYTHLDGPHGRVPVGKFKIGLIAQERKPHLTNHVVGDPRVGDQDWAKREGMVAFAGYPLLVESHLVGVIAMFARHTLTDVTLQSLASISNTIALGIERKLNEEGLRESRYRLDLALEASGFAVWEWNLATGDVRFSRHWWPILGYEPDEVPLRIEAWENLTQPDDLVRVRTMLAAVAKRSISVLDVEYRMHTKNGEWRWIRSVGQVVERDAGGRVLRMTGTHGDITERKEQDQRIARLSRIHAVLSGINSAIARIRDRNEMFNEACRIAVEHGGFSVGWVALLDHATGKLVPVAQAGLPIDPGVGNLSSDGAGGIVPAGVAEIALREKRPAVDNNLEAAPGIPNSEAGSDTLSVRRAAIEHGAKSVIVMPLFEEAQTFGVLTLYAPERDFFDDEELKLLKELSADVSFALTFIAKEEKVNYLAYHDALTDLPNRALLLDRLGQYVHAAQRQHRVAAVVLADLERFHVINDTLGRSVGDAFLREIAKRLKEHVRAEDTVARVGGDSFAVALTNVGSAAEVAHLLQDRVSAFLRRPIALAGQELYPSARFGAAVYPSDGDSPETLYTNAEAALKDAKTTGEQFLFYAPEMNARIAESLALESKLRLALERGQFVLHYQPKVALRDRRLTGFEALIRWNDAELGLVPPVKFIPLMEQTGLILDAGRWALSQVARDCRSWSTNGVKPPRVAVNASPLQLRQKDFVDSVIEAAEKTREAGGMLDLEITESLIMENVEAVTHKLQTIRGLGVEISVDDFGTGYSSLAYVARLPIHALKIDRSFVVGMTDSRESLAIVNSVISMAHALSLQVVAEGVETEEQAAQLEKLGCDQMQGYLVSKPLPPEEIPALLRHYARVRSPVGKGRRSAKPGHRRKTASKG